MPAPCAAKMSGPQSVFLDVSFADGHSLEDGQNS